MAMIRETMLKRLLLPKIMAGGGGGAPVQATAMGNPVVFETDLDRPLKSLLIPFTPVQSGTGDPSPQNVRPIVPWDGLTVWNGGKNLLNPATIRKQGNDNLWWYEQGGLFLHAGTYCFTFARTMTGFYVIDANTGTSLRTRYNSATDKFTLTEDHSIKINVYVSGGVSIDDEAILEAGDTATAYEPYIPITETDISFPSPVYGGELDVVSGVLTVKWVKYSAKWSEWETGEVLTNVTRKTLTLPQSARYLQRSEGNSITNVTNVYLNSNSSDTIHYYVNTRGNVFYVFLPNDTDGDIVVEICGKLIEPYEITLTPEQITALKGNNTIWSDANGEMTATYLKKA